jgi:hypothetical protein
MSPFTVNGARRAARETWPCPYCDKKVRPCNYDRHMLARHPEYEQPPGVRRRKSGQESDAS